MQEFVITRLLCCINTCWVIREMFECSAWHPHVQTASLGPENFNAQKECVIPIFFLLNNLYCPDHKILVIIAFVCSKYSRKSVQAPESLLFSYTKYGYR